jgi:hypothetical protein
MLGVKWTGTPAHSSADMGGCAGPFGVSKALLGEVVFVRHDASRGRSLLPAEISGSGWCNLWSGGHYHMSNNDNAPGDIDAVRRMSTFLGQVVHSFIGSGCPPRVC